MSLHSRHVGVYTPADPPRIHVPPQIVRLVLAANVSYLLSGLRATLVALPIALVAVPGPPRVLGIVYLVCWFVVMSPSTGVYLLLLADCYLILRGKESVLLIRALTSLAQTQRSERPAVEDAFRRAAKFSSEANPMANLVVAVVHFTVRHRNWVFAEAMSHRARCAPVVRPHSPEPEIEFAAPVLRRVPELVAEPAY